MDVLIVETLDAEVLRWLGARYPIQVAPELAQDAPGFRRALAQARAVILPPSAVLDAATLQRAPRLRIAGRISAGAENIDLDACARQGVEVVRPATASAAAEAEFVIASLLAMLRRVPIINAEGLLVGRELGGCTVGLVGMTPAVKPLAALLNAFGARVLGYDPSTRADDPQWEEFGVEPVGLRGLMNTCDGVCVLLQYFSRYVGLFGDRLLSQAKPNQVLVSLAHSSLFDDVALARVLTQGPLAAAWLDSVEPGTLDPGRPLRHVDTLQVTPRVSSVTQASLLRGAWAVASRIDEVLAAPVAVPAAPTAADLKRQAQALRAGPQGVPRFA